MINRLLLCLLLLPLHLLSQNQPLALEQIVNGELNPQGLEQLQWRGNTSFFTYVKGEEQTLLQNGADTVEHQLLTLSQLNQKLSAYSIGLGNLPNMSWANDSTLQFWHGSSLFSFDVNHQTCQEVAVLEKGAANKEVNTQGHIAYTVGGHLWVNYRGGNYKISQDANSNVHYGLAAYRQEFGIQKGIFWSPKGNKLAYYRIDQTEVTDYPLVDFSKMPAEQRLIKYPMAGQKSEVTTIGIYDLEHSKNIYLKTGSPSEQYLTNITWSPDERSLYVAVVNRAQNKMMLNQYDATTGEFIQTLFEEEDEKYVEPEHGMIFLPNREQFLWLSERDGFKHLYLYRTNGHLVRQLTGGPWEVTEFLGFNKLTTKAFFVGTEVSPLERHIYTVGLMGLPVVDKVKRLSLDDGVHKAMLGDGGNYILNVFSNRITPMRTQLLRAGNGRPIKRLLESENPLKNHQIGDVELFHLRADDSEKLYCRMIKPADFDTTKKYPVIVYVYGGPHIQLIDESWLGDSRNLMFLHYLANQGYIVFTMDSRGSANRGLEFEQSIYRNMGTVEVEDQMKGVTYLEQLSYVDKDRIGVYGGSYGGFMTISLMLKHAKYFKAGIARGPVTDWNYYEVMYTERYMDTPKENPGGYMEANLMNHIGKLKGKLLIMHGMQDSTVVPQHTFSFLQAAANQRVDIDFFPYPTQAHSVKGKERIDFYRRIAAYFEEHL